MSHVPCCAAEQKNDKLCFRISYSCHFNTKISDYRVKSLFNDPPVRKLVLTPIRGCQ